MPSPDTKFFIHKQAPKLLSKVPVFSILRNEMYFLPHLLRHYREMGVGEFLFLDDASTDGTFEYLQEQPDCTVMRSNWRFGDQVGGRFFGVTAKSLVPRTALMNRWVLTIDADEFLLLPPGFKTLDELAMCLDANGLRVARALMVDFFPATLGELDGAPREKTPFELNPFFDVWEQMVWPDNEPNVTEISVRDAIRPRLVYELAKRGLDIKHLLTNYKFANVNKSPLYYWEKDSYATTSHRVSALPSDRIQLVLAHFKFYPGHEARTAEALALNVHWLNAVEYRFLDLSNRHLKDWPLAGPRTRRFNSVDDMVESGLLYSRLSLPA